MPEWTRRRSLHLMKAELEGVVIRKLRREEHATIIFEADQSSIKQEVCVGGQHQAVETVESFLRATTSSPWLYVTGPQKGWLLDACHATDRFHLEHVAPKYSLSAPREGQLLAHSVVEGLVVLNPVLDFVIQCGFKVRSRSIWPRLSEIRQS
jgi:hypothetical protein